MPCAITFVEGKGGILFAREDRLSVYSRKMHLHDIYHAMKTNHFHCFNGTLDCAPSFSLPSGIHSPLNDIVLRIWRRVKILS